MGLKWRQLARSNQQMSTHMNLPSPRHEAEITPGIRTFEECSQWRALRVRPRWEKLVAGAIHGKEYEAFLPLYRKRSQWSDRVKEVELPLFSGYVFCRGDFSGGPRLVTTPGVIGILSFGGVPAMISEGEIEAIKSVIQSGLCAEPWPYLREGQRVRVHAGALTGVEGILVRTKNDCRVVLSVEALCRSVAVEVHRECVTPTLSSATS
jgi:transcription antitermination factor NusG